MNDTETDIHFSAWKDSIPRPVIVVCNGSIRDIAMGILTLKSEARPTIFCHTNFKKKKETNPKIAIRKIVSDLKKDGYTTGYYFYDSDILSFLPPSNCNKFVAYCASELATKIGADKILNKGKVLYPDGTIKCYPEINKLNDDQILKLYIDYQSFDLLKYTWSCIKDDAQMCGVCEGCLSRKRAFADLYKDPYYLQYQDNAIYEETLE